MKLIGAHNPYAYSRPKHNLHFTENKLNVFTVITLINKKLLRFQRMNMSICILN